MPITSSRPTSQGAGCLNTVLPLPHHQTPLPPDPDIGKNSRNGRGYGLAHAIWAVEHGGLDLMETSRTEACSKNRRGYVMRVNAVQPSHAGGAQDNMGLGLQDRTKGWGSESTRFHGPNIVIYEIMWKVSDVEPG